MPGRDWLCSICSGRRVRSGSGLDEKDITLTLASIKVQLPLLAAQTAIGPRDLQQSASGDRAALTMEEALRTIVLFRAV